MRRMRVTFWILAVIILVVYGHIRAAAASDLIFADDFESRNFLGWSSSSTNAGNLSVSANAALNGSYGMQAVLTAANNTTMYVRDDSPNAEPRYRARFYFDPNSLVMTSGDYQYILVGFANSTNTAVLRVAFKNTSGVYQLNARILNDSAVWQTTPYISISDAPHTIEVDWEAASAVGANDGHLTFWVDGVQQGSLTGLANDMYRMESVRLGVPYLSITSTAGTLYFDAFESRRQTYIGFAGTPLPTLTPTASFTPVPAGVIRFAVIGDYGSHDQAEANVASLIKSWNPDFVITTGDNNYPLGEATTIDQNIGQYYHDFIYPYAGSYGAGAASNRFFPSLGNHDWDLGNTQAYEDYFTLPGNERYYDFVWGPVHFFILDSDSQEPDGTSSTSTQALWLQTRLAASTSPWNLVYFHHSPYSSGLAHGSTLIMQWPFQAWGADAVLSGHDHIYERVILNGFPYFVDGLGGKDIYALTTPVPGSEVRYNNDHGAMLVEAGASYMTFQFITVTGALIDTYTIGSPSTATPTDTATSTETGTPTATASPSQTPTPTFTPTDSATPTSSLTSILTSTPTETGTSTVTASPSQTPTPTFTPTYTSTSTATRTLTPTSSPTLSSTPIADLIFANGFESGNLSAWSSSVTDAGDLNVSSGAALTGNYGLQAVIDDNNAICLADDSPNSETRYRARFHFDPNSITMAGNDAHYIFYGYTGASTVVLRIEFRYSKGSYQLRAALRNDSSSWTSSSWFTITDAPHVIELDWRASTASGANNGSLTLWIDSIQRAALTGMDNDTRRIDRIQLGSISGIDSGTRGTYYFDAFESRRQTYIGP